MIPLFVLDVVILFVFCLLQTPMFCRSNQFKDDNDPWKDKGDGVVNSQPQRMDNMVMLPCPQVGRSATNCSLYIYYVHFYHMARLRLRGVHITLAEKSIEILPQADI